MQKISLQCDSCQHRFKRNTAPKLCPNCGKENVVHDRRMDAEQILKELDEMSENFR